MIKKKNIIVICKIKECNNSATTKGYCRIHYLKHWEDIHTKKKKPVRKPRKRRNSKKEDKPIENDLADFCTGEGYDEDTQALIDGLKIETEF